METITMSAIKWRRKGETEWRVDTGLRHAYILQIFRELGIKRADRDEVQGFMTDTGRFVDRTEALEIAKASGQLPYPVPDTKTELLSEDVW